MAESQGKGLKTPVNGLFRENFEFGPLLGYDNFQNAIDTWETTVEGDIVFKICFSLEKLYNFLSLKYFNVGEPW